MNKRLKKLKFRGLENRAEVSKVKQLGVRRAIWAVAEMPAITNGGMNAALNVSGNPQAK